MARLFCQRMRMVLSIFMLVISLAVSAAFAQEPLPAPTGPVLLTISGTIAVTNSDMGAQFDRQMLSALGMSKIETSTSWTDGVQVFEGVLMRTVLERVGAKGETITATALNDFTSPMPMEDAQNYDVMLAMRMNGADMPVSAKGPIWIVYPKDQHPELEEARFNDRWVWQLKQLAVQ